MHPPPGVIFLGSPNVEIGGTTTGVTLGNLEAALAACVAASAGRKSGATRQSYDNCGVEASRIVINQAKGKHHTEDEVLDYALGHGYADKGEHGKKGGGTGPASREKILHDYGVGSEQKPQNLDSLAQDVAEGKGIITRHDAGILWNDKNYLGGGHAVVMTGVSYDKDGNIESVIVLDTGTGNCESKIPVDRFNKSLRKGPNVANVTQQPIWPVQ